MYQDIHKANFWNFWKNSNFLLFIDIEWLEMIVSNKKWSLLMILTTKKAAHIAKFAEFVWFVWLCSNVQIVYWTKIRIFLECSFQPQFVLSNKALVFEIAYILELKQFENIYITLFVLLLCILMYIFHSDDVCRAYVAIFITR